MSSQAGPPPPPLPPAPPPLPPTTLSTAPHQPPPPQAKQVLSTGALGQGGAHKQQQEPQDCGVQRRRIRICGNATNRDEKIFSLTVLNFRFLKGV